MPINETRQPVHHRVAKTADLPEIVRIYNASIPGRLATADLEPVTVAERASWFRAHSAKRRPIWIATTGTSVDGWVSFSDFYGRPAYAATAELSVYVDPTAHGRGVGRHLLHAAITGAPVLGLTTLLGFIFDHNEPSLGLFESEGFERWAHLPRVAVLDGIDRGLVIVGRRVEATTLATTASTTATTTG